MASTSMNEPTLSRYSSEEGQAPTISNSDIHHTDSSKNAQDRAREFKEEANAHDKATPSALPFGPAKPQKYSQGFFDPEMAGLRKLTFKLMGLFTVMIILTSWATLTVFWGSFSHAPERSHHLSIAVIDQDTPSISGGLPAGIPTLGQYVTQACLANANGSTTRGHRGTLGFWEADASEYTTRYDIEEAVRQEKFWAAVVIPVGATASLQRARERGDTSYTPTGGVIYIYNQGRNENAAGSYIVPIGQAVLAQATANYSAISAAQYLTSIAGNQTALEALIAAPRTLGVSYYLDNLTNFANAPTTPAATLVGGIFIVVFAFLLVNAFNIVREMVGPFLRTKQYIAFRMIVPAVCYLFVSLSISMLNLPFKAPFDAHFSYGTGWFIWWMACYCAMMACGFALEFWITILTPKFTPFMMLFIILYQVSTVTLPPELLISFYHYGIGVPLNRTNNILRTLVFDTKDELALGFGVLLGWMFLSWCITMPLITLFYRRREIKAFQKERPTTVTA